MAPGETGDFQVGDVVKCVDAEGRQEYLWEGQTHTIVGVDKRRFMVEIAGYGPWLSSRRFVLEHRPVAALRVPASEPGQASDPGSPAKYVRPSTAKTSSPNPKDFIGITKVPVGLFPSAGTILGAMSMKDGAVKYGPYNWREHPVKMTVYLDAMERHLLALRDGEDEASDSGVHHLGHILGCAAILADAIAVGNLIDDRPHKGAAAALFEKFREKKEAA